MRGESPKSYLRAIRGHSDGELPPYRSRESRLITKPPGRWGGRSELQMNIMICFSVNKMFIFL